MFWSRDKQSKLFLLLVFILAAAVRFYRLDDIPGEWFGDISNVYEYVEQIIKGEWPFYFFQSSGPLYHYVITPIVLVMGNHGYLTYKIASVIVSLVDLYLIYLFAKEIAGKEIALMTMLVSSFSFWFLVWSRIGNSQIIIVGLSAWMGYHLVSFCKRGRLTDIIWGAAVASMGWYTYPQTFIFPVIFLLILFLYPLFFGKKKQSSNKLLTSVVVLVMLTLPFLEIVMKQKDNFTGGYLGQKISPIFSQSPRTTLKKFITNYANTALMLHVAGDKTFRTNVPGKPHLDKVSGILFVLGLVYVFGKNRRLILFIAAITMLLVLPAASPSISPDEIPNNGRTIAIIPYIFLIVAAGYLWIYKVLIRVLKTKLLSLAILTIITSYSAFLNLQTYFSDYAHGLPDYNQAWGKDIAGFIDKLPAEINIYFGSCCWGEWGHPEPKAIAYILRNKRDFIKYDHTLVSCEEIVRLPAAVIVGPNDNDVARRYYECFPQAIKEAVVNKKGALVSRVIRIE